MTATLTIDPQERDTLHGLMLRRLLITWQSWRTVRDGHTHSHSH